jgi:sporulation integral membrane protein YtvI
MNNRLSLRLDRIALYAVSYTFIFLILGMTMPYILPFILGTIVALIAQPPINYITKKFNVKRSPVGIIIVLFIFAFIFTIIVLIVTSVINELISLSKLLPDSFVILKRYWTKYLDMAASYFNTLDPAVIESIKSAANKLFSDSFTAAFYVVNSIANILKSLPGLLMLIIFTLLSSIYIAIDLPRINKKIFSFFTKEDSFRIKHVIYESNKMIINYLKAYMVLISLTFIETFIFTSILRLKYALLISIATAISDFLPILGPGTVLIPIALIYIFVGNYIQGIGVLITFTIIIIIRQILEPKIVSSTLGIYPLIIIIAIFVGLTIYGFTGMIFTVFFVVFYVILRKVGIL